MTWCDYTMFSRHTLDHNVAMGTNGHSLVGAARIVIRAKFYSMMKMVLHIWVEIMQVSSNMVERPDIVQQTYA